VEGTVSTTEGNARETTPEGPSEEGPDASLSWIARLKSAVTLVTWVLPAAIVAGFFVVVIRPWEDPVPLQEDVASLWSESVSRLGIEPLFPPQEDFHVGDVYAVISAYDEADGTTREKAPDRPLLRKSAKIGHINLRSISLGTPEAPVFAPTKLNNDATAALLDQVREEIEEPASGKIKVSVVSFPAITVRSASANAATWVDLLPFSAGRSRENEEIITIRTAESYGASTVEATLAFNKWCQDRRTKLSCTDAFARKILGYTTNSDVLEVRDNRYVYRISIKLITQVYLTRAIDFKRSSGGELNASIWEPDSGVAADRSAVAGAPSAENAPEQADASQKPPTRGIGTKTSADTTMVIGNVIYPRPVVFGFKSVTFSLDPSTPVTSTAPDNAER
jgi:hypothetical protein